MGACVDVRASVGSYDCTLRDIWSADDDILNVHMYLVFVCKVV